MRPPPPPDPAADARWHAAPLTAAVLRAVAADRGCEPHHLSAALCGAVESAVLAWIAEQQERGTWDDSTPVVVYEAHDEHPSERVTVPAGSGERALPKGVKAR